VSSGARLLDKFFSPCMIFSSLPYFTNVFIVAYFVLQLRFWLPEEGNHQTHALEVFNHTAHKVVKDEVFNARIQANNAYYNDVIGL
jgi:hypothetical protein